MPSRGEERDQLAYVDGQGRRRAVALDDAAGLDFSLAKAMVTRVPGLHRARCRPGGPVPGAGHVHAALRVASLRERLLDCPGCRLRRDGAFLDTRLFPLKMACLRHGYWLYGDGAGSRLQLAVSDRVSSLAQTFLGDSDLRINTAEAWAKYAGAADYDQPLHRDYLNHTLTVPTDDPRFRQLEMFVYLVDVPEELGPPGNEENCSLCTSACTRCMSGWVTPPQARRRAASWTGCGPGSTGSAGA
jgi:hypothetical protein